MFDTINGIPLHPLIVHGVVVLLPLTILGTIALAVRPAWRSRFGLLVVGIGVVGTVLVPAATSSGEEFEHRVGKPGEHAELGDQLIWFVLPMMLLLIAMVVLDRRAAAGGSAEASPGSDSGATALKVVAVLSILASLAAGFQVYRVGDSGARAAWCGEGNPAYSCTTVR